MLLAQCLYMPSEETPDAPQDCATVIVSQGQKRMARVLTTPTKTTDCTNTQTQRQVKSILIGYILHLFL